MKTKRRGFTIVELVIVIAVIGILTAVLVPTFTSLINKANITADASTAKTLNTYLAADEVNGQPATMTDVVEVLDEHGYRLEKLKLKDGESKLLWDEENNRFVVVKGDDVIYSEGKVTEKDYKLWEIIDKAEGIQNVENQKYSMYLTSGLQVATINSRVGVDVGSNLNVSAINYANNRSEQTVTILTNGGTLSINAPRDTVNHFGAADKVLIEAVAGNSYHENGVVPNIEIKQGRVEIAQTAEVNTVIVTGNNVVVDTVDENVDIKVDAVVTTLPTVRGTTKEIETVKKITTLADLRTAIASDNFNVVLGANITGGITIQKSGKIDLNGYKLQNVGTVLSISGDAEVVVCGSGLIKSTGNVSIWVTNGAKATFSDISVEAQEAAICAQYAGEVTINSGVYTAIDNFVIGSNGSKGRGNNKFTINGGTFNGNIQSAGYIACGIYVANDDTVVVNAGEFNITNGVVILMRAGKTTINEGVVCNVTSTGTISSGRIGDSRINIETTTYFVIDYKSNYPGMNDDFYCHNNTEYALTEINAAN